jgi:hypothetical protein
MGLIDLSGLRGEIFEAGAFGTLEAKTSQGKADHAKRGERVTATVRANDSLAGSLEMGAERDVAWRQRQL